MVFEYNWFGSLLNVHEPAPVISFLPILLMGILFGLAMDYEVFLVSRIREEYVHGDNARAAIEDGFAASSRVVAAAAVIMIGVFAAFVPEGEGAIKPISLGLAVGVFVDAFIVRMTLVPAVLFLLGENAWWLPKWLDRRLPSFDVEGAGLVHQVSLAEWPAPNDRHLVYAEGLEIGGRGPVAISAMPREVVVVEGPHDTDRTSLLLTLAGRMKITSGRAKIAGLVLPEQAGQVRARTGYLDCATSTDLRRDLRVLAKAKPKIIFIDHADLLSTHDDRAALASLLDDLDVQSHEQSVVLAVRSQSSIADLVRGPFSCVTLGRTDDLIGTPTH